MNSASNNIPLIIIHFPRISLIIPASSHLHHLFDRAFIPNLRPPFSPTSPNCPKKDWSCGCGGCKPTFPTSAARRTSLYRQLPLHLDPCRTQYRAQHHDYSTSLVVKLGSCCLVLELSTYSARIPILLSSSWIRGETLGFYTCEQSQTYST
jgi:hypothetical protein